MGDFNMSKIKSLVNIIIIIMLFLILHNAIVVFSANIFSNFRENNLDELTIESYENKITSLEKSLSEYERTIDNFKIYEHDSYVLGKIALRDVYDFYDILEISTKFPVEKGSAVINEKGLVGIVSSSNKNTAKVELITGKTKISVKVGSSYGILNGYDKKENLLFIRNINNYEKIEDGSLVTTSGLEKIEEGLKIGNVLRTEKNGIEQIVYVTPIVDFSRLNYLMVIDK